MQLLGTRFLKGPEIDTQRNMDRALTTTYAHSNTREIELYFCGRGSADETAIVHTPISRTETPLALLDCIHT